MDDLKLNLKKDIIESLNLVGITPENIKDDQPLFDSDLGLDSIDALELIVLLEKNYGVKISNPEEGKDVFHSVNSMANFVEEKRS